MTCTDGGPRPVSAEEANRFLAGSGIAAAHFNGVGFANVSGIDYQVYFATKFHVSASAMDLQKLAFDFLAWVSGGDPIILWVETLDATQSPVIRAFEYIRDSSQDHQTLVDAPGTLFTPVSSQMWHDPDLFEEVSRMSFLAACCMVGGWNAKIISLHAERVVEFWEGNAILLTQSFDTQQKAEAIGASYDLPKELK